MLVYKVCKVENGRYFSLHGEHFPTYKVEYTVGEFTYPVVGKLFAYPSIYDWPEYDFHLPHLAVLLCEAEFAYVESQEVLDIEEVEILCEVYWNKLESKSPFLFRTHLALCYWIKPIKVLSDEELKTLFAIHQIR